MTHSQGPPPDPDSHDAPTPPAEPSPSPPPAGRFWLRVGLTVGGTVALVVGLGAWRGWVFANNGLSPWLSAQLSDTLNRPVELGDIEAIGLTRLRVGPSVLPPTATDPDTLALAGLEVRYNLLELFRRRLGLDIYLDDLTVYIEQTADGAWVDLALDREPAKPDAEEPRPPFIRVEPEDIRLRGGTLTLVPYAETAPSPVAFTDLNAQVTLRTARVGPEGATVQEIDGSVRARTGGGQLEAEGSVRLPAAESALTAVVQTALGDGMAAEGKVQVRPWLEHLPALSWIAPVWAADEADLQAQVNLQVTDITVPDLMPLVEALVPTELPLEITSGQVSGQVRGSWLGDGPLTLDGTARVQDGSTQLEALPAPLEGIGGTVRFADQTLTFERVTATLADLSATAQGTLDLQQGYNLSGQIDPFTPDQIAQLFDLELPVETEGRFGVEVAMTGPLDRPEIATTVASQGLVVIDKVPLADLSAQVTVQTPDVLVLDQFRAAPQAGGQLVGQGTYRFDTQRLALTLDADQLPADALGQAYGLPDTVTLGPVSAEAEVAGPLDNLAAAARWRAPAGDYPAQGAVSLANNQVRFTDTVVQVAGGQVSGEGTLANGRWEAALQAQNLDLQQLGLPTSGTARGTAQAAGTLTDFSLETITGQGEALVAVAGGTVTGQVDVGQGQWTATAQAEQVALSSFDPQLQGQASGQAAARGSLSDFSPAGIQGEGQFTLSEGLATAAGQVPALETLRDPLVADLAWDGQLITVRQASTAGLFAQGTLTPLLSGPGAPTIADMDLNLEVSRYDLATLPLPPVVPVTGQASFSGHLTGSLETLRLSGDAQLANLAVSDLVFDPLLVGPVEFEAATGLAVDLQGSRRPDAITVAYGFDQQRLDLRIQADTALAVGQTEGEQFTGALTNFPIEVLNLPPGGLGNVGTVRGLVESATIVANLQEPTVLVDFAIADPAVGFITLRDANDPRGVRQDQTYSRLEGKFTYADNTFSLLSTELATVNDDSRYLLTGWFTTGPEPEFSGQVSVENGNIEDVLLTAQVFNFADFSGVGKAPEWFRRYSPAELEAILATQPAGQADASLLDQLRRLAEILELEDQLVAREAVSPLPPITDLRGRFGGDITVTGSLPPGEAPAVTVAADLEGVNWQWGEAYTFDQVIVAGSYADGIIEAAPVRIAYRIPPAVPELLPEPATEPDADGTANPATAVLDNAPIDVAVASLNGSFSLNKDEGVGDSDTVRTLGLTIDNVPFDALRHPLQLPTALNGIDGTLNGSATLTGSLANPQVRGGLKLDNAVINGNPIDDAGTRFVYQNARLNLVSDLTINGTDDPLKLTATVPYRLPFAEVPADSSDFLIDLAVSNDGLTVLTALTPEVGWEAGTGEVDVKILGTWSDGASVPDLGTLVVDGVARFEDGVVSARVLPEPLTDLNGTILLKLDRVVVDELSGQFSNGQLQARGTFPFYLPLESSVVQEVSAPLASTQTEAGAGGPVTLPANPEQPADGVPLTLVMRNIALNLKGAYSGQVDGEMMVKGTLLLGGPQLAGTIRLSDGVLSLPDTSASDGAAGAGATPAPVRFADFKLLLRNNVRLAVPGLVDVRAEGGITVDGLFPDLQLAGRINLPSGRINLVTTQFSLTGGDNYAQFTRNRGLDPYISATLRAAVPDTAGGDSDLIAATPFPRNEVDDSELNTLNLNQSGVETIRIRAQVDGPASQLATLQGVQLSSSPPRSNGEIVTLISGGILTALESTVTSVSGGGDGFSGLIALAGSALLNNVQDVLGDALSISELRLYTVTPNSAQAAGNSIDIGGEIGVEFSPSISASVQTVFNNIDPTLFNLRYRINDQFVLRGTTSLEEFNENTGVILEFNQPLR